MHDASTYPEPTVSPVVDRTRWQPVNRSGLTLRWLFLGLVGLSTACGIAAATWLLAPETVTGHVAAAVLLGCFTVLFTWIAANFWLTVIGFGRFCAIRRRNRAHGAGAPVVSGTASQTAVVVPVYNEDPARVASGIQAMMESLAALDALDRFDFYILSDSTDPDIWVREEQAWLALAEQERFRNHVFYRRRPENSERKSGNIKQFLENWGHEYRYMLTLDADSVVSGETMVEMVRRMDRDPTLGLLQTWPRVIGGTTLFARMHQYAAGLYGRILACGMAALINPHGNYWGHNAIVRVDAFMDCCGLPRLPGRAPLGGEILSHDFVEAALLVRRGWKVELAADLDGSYEEAPPNIIQHVARDQRWCQGNLQHAWLLFARGIHPASRTNFLTGILAYASSPVWLLFVLVASVMAFSEQSLFSAGLVLVEHADVGWRVESSSVESMMAIGLLGATLTFILAPKLIGVIAAVTGREEPLHRLVANVLAETVLSVLVAPTVMLRHSIFVGRLLLGRGVDWKPQQRDTDRIAWAEAWRTFGPQTMVALAAAATAAVWPSMVHLWLSPILVGLAVSVPLAVWTGRVPRRPGRLLRTAHDCDPPEILRRTRELRERAATLLDGDPMLDVLGDTRAHHLHMYILATDPEMAPDHGGADGRVDDDLLAQARHAPAELAREGRMTLLRSTSALRRLYLESFCNIGAKASAAGRAGK